MSEPRRPRWHQRVAVAFALAFGSAASVAAAQSVEEYRANVARLERAVTDAQAAVESAEAARRARVPTLTVRASGFVILTTPELERLAREAALLAEPQLRSTFGALYSEVAARPFVLRTPVSLRAES